MVIVIDSEQLRWTVWCWKWARYSKEVNNQLESTKPEKVLKCTREHVLVTLSRSSWAFLLGCKLVLGGFWNTYVHSLFNFEWKCMSGFSSWPTFPIWHSKVFFRNSRMLNHTFRHRILGQRKSAKYLDKGRAFRSCGRWYERFADVFSLVVRRGQVLRAWGIELRSASSQWQTRAETIVILEKGKYQWTVLRERIFQQIRVNNNNVKIRSAWTHLFGSLWENLLAKRFSHTSKSEWFPYPDILSNCWRVTSAGDAFLRTLL